MDSHSPQHKTQRRKRKDPESRDYACKCGKSYLSYAAAYTHVKNKHNGDKQLLDSIAKPERQKLKRGRPKQRKVLSVSEEATKLSIIEETILLIYQSLKKDEDRPSGETKVALEGNEEVGIEQLVRFYDEVIEENGDPGINIIFERNRFGKDGERICKFIEGINKHFQSTIAVKVMWMMNYLIAKCSNLVTGKESDEGLFLDFESMKEMIKEPIISKIWKKSEQVPELIVEAFQKWAKATWEIERS